MSSYFYFRFFFMLAMIPSFIWARSLSFDLSKARHSGQTTLKVEMSSSSVCSCLMISVESLEMPVFEKETMFSLSPGME
jgi:hypothetical protein